MKKLLRLSVLAVALVLTLAGGGAALAPVSHAAPLASGQQVAQVGVPGATAPLSLPAHWPDPRFTVSRGEGPLTLCGSTAFYTVATGGAHTTANYSVTPGLAALLDTNSGIYCGKMYGYGHWTIYHNCHTFTAAIVNWQIGGGTTQGSLTTGSKCSGTNQFWAGSTLSEPSGGGDTYSGIIYADGNPLNGNDTASYTP